jgi:hypothetical protein
MDDRVLMQHACDYSFSSVCYGVLSKNFMGRFGLGSAFKSVLSSSNQLALLILQSSVCSC